MVNRQAYLCPGNLDPGHEAFLQERDTREQEVLSFHWWLKNISSHYTAWILFHGSPCYFRKIGEWVLFRQKALPQVGVFQIRLQVLSQLWSDLGQIDHPSCPQMWDDAPLPVPHAIPFCRIYQAHSAICITGSRGSCRLHPSLHNNIAQCFPIAWLVWLLLHIVNLALQYCCSSSPCR